MTIQTEPQQQATDITPHNQTVELRAARAAASVGIDTTAVERLPFDLSALEDEGVFVNVDACGFGLLDRRLDWRTLGVMLPEGADLAFRPPRYGLLPDRFRLPLLRPAARAHAALHKYSYRFTLTETLFETPAYRWVPWRAFATFERDFRVAQEALSAAKESAVAHYEEMRQELAVTFRGLAADSACRLAATGQTINDGFEDAILQGLSDALPSPTDLQEKLSLRYRVGVILLGSEMLAEQRRAREERRRLEEVEGVLRLEQRHREAHERLVQQELWAEEERIRRRLQAEDEERRREGEVKERLRQLKLDAARERLQEAISPLEEGAKQLHAAVYEAAAAMRASLQKNGHLHGSSVRRARELARWFHLMNWQSDHGLEALLTELEQLASRPAGSRTQRSAGAVDQVLGDIIELCYADARSLAQVHRMDVLEL